MTDEDLLKGLLNNDTLAIRTIYDRCFFMVQSYIMKNKGSIEDTKDVFQEAIMVLHEKVRVDIIQKDKKLVLTCKLSTYIYSVSKNIWLKRLEQQNKMPYIFSGWESGNNDIVDESVLDIDRYEAKEKQFHIMERALKFLGEPCRRLIESFYLKEMSMQEIARSFGYTNAENAKTQKYKCFMRLKKIIDQEMYND